MMLVDRYVAFVPGGRRRHQVRNLAALAGSDAWERRWGAHGERLYDWTVLTLDPAGITGGFPAGWGYWLLVRLPIDPPPGTAAELAFYPLRGPKEHAGTQADPRRRSKGGRSRSASRPDLVGPHHPAVLAAAYLAATRAQEVKKGDPRPVAVV